MWLILSVLLSIFLTLFLPWILVPWYVTFTCFVAFMTWYPQRSEWVRKSFLGSFLRRSVNYKAEQAAGTTDFDTGEHYIFSLHPHGMFCFSEMLTFIFDNAYTPLGALAQETIPLVATELLWVPIIGHLACALGCQSVEREHVNRLLTEKKSVALTPGGVREVKYASHCRPGHITLLRNTGFLKLAFSKKVSAVPILVLGESSCYRFFKSFEGLQNLSIKLVGWPFPMFALGRWGSFWPRKDSSVKLVIGNPVSPEHCENVEGFVSAYYEELGRIAASQDTELEFRGRNGNVLPLVETSSEGQSESGD